MVRLVIPVLVALAMFAAVMLTIDAGRRQRARAIARDQRTRRAAQVSLTAAPAPDPDDAWLPVERSLAAPPVRLPSGGVRVELRPDPGNPDAVAVFVGDQLVGRLPERVTGAYRGRLSTNNGALGAVGLNADGLLTLVPVGLTRPTPPQYLHLVQAWGWSTTAVSSDRVFVYLPGVAQVFARAERPITEAATTLDDLTAALLLDDEGFVDVLVGDAWIGSLAEPDAEQIRPALQRLARTGGLLQVGMRLVARRRSGRLLCRVTLRLPDPNQINPPGPLPDAPFVLLPPVTTLQVTGEKAALDLLAPLLGSGAQASVVVTLHTADGLDDASAPHLTQLAGPGDEPLGEAVGATDVAVPVDADRVRAGARLTPAEPSRVEVRVDGRPVGLLSAAGSAATHGLVRACEEAGRVPVARGLVNGNSLAVTMAVRTARTWDVTDEWLLRELGG